MTAGTQIGSVPTASTHRRGRLLRVPWALVAFTLIACGPGGTDSSDEPTILTVAYDSQERLLAPAADDTPKFLTFLPLRDSRWYCWGREEWERRYGWPPPGLAESIEVSEDGRVWTVTLRDDLTWHDGVPVTAHDVKFTTDLGKLPEVLYYGQSWSRVTVLDDRTLRIELAKPGNLGMAGWMVHFPRHLLEHLPPEQFYDWEFWDHPVGDGPFRLVRNVPGQVLEFEPYDGYPDAKPGYDLLRLKLTAASPVTELLSGGVDLVTMTPAEATRFRGNPEFRVSPRFDYGGAWLLWNLRDARFKDARVRRAMAHAIDRRTLLEVLDLPADAPITDGRFTPCQFHRDELLEPLEHDPALAERLLDEAGWIDRDGDGVRERGSVPLAFSVLTAAEFETGAVYLEDQLRRVGIGIEIVMQDRGAVSERFRSGNFEAVLGPALSTSLEYLRSSDSPFGYDNPRVDELLDRAHEAASWEEQAPAYREISEITRADLAALYLHPRGQFIVARARVRNLEALFRSGNMWGLEYLRVQEPEEQR